MLHSNLTRRIVSAAILIPIVLGLLWLDNMGAYLIIWAALLALLLSEWNAVTSNAPTLTQLPLWVSLLWCLTLNMLGLHALALLLPALTSAYFLYQHRDWHSIGALYLAIPTSAFLWLASTHGAPALLWLLLIIWATDIGGYVIGKTVGGAKLCPAISPGKTISGLAGCMVFSMFAAMSYSLVQHVPVTMPMILAAAFALLAQAGDLFQSYLKRKAGKKDSGTLIPGHGGAWDRLDGLLVVAPALAAILYLQPHLASWLGW